MSSSPKELERLNRESNKPIAVGGVEKSGYEWKQAMHRLEAEATKEKEIINSLKAAGDEEGARQHRKRLRAISEKYNNICSQTGLTPQKDRIRVYGGTNTAKNSQIAIASGGESGIINNKENFIGSIFDNNGYNPADIQRAITQKGTNFVTTDINNQEYDFGVAIENVQKLPDFYDVKAHGDYDGIKVFDSAIGAPELAKILLLRNDYNGQPIRLLSCNTGRMVNGTCFAQELSNILGVDVIAPNDIIVTDGKGLLRIGKDRFKDTGEFVCFKPK